MSINKLQTHKDKMDYNFTLLKEKFFVKCDVNILNDKHVKSFILRILNFLIVIKLKHQSFSSKL